MGKKQSIFDVLQSNKVKINNLGPAIEDQDGIRLDQGLQNASEVEFDNTNTTLVSTDVQSVIEEINNIIDNNNVENKTYIYTIPFVENAPTFTSKYLDIGDVDGAFNLGYVIPTTSAIDRFSYNFDITLISLLGQVSFDIYINNSIAVSVPVEITSILPNTYNGVFELEDPFPLNPGDVVRVRLNMGGVNLTYQNVITLVAIKSFGNENEPSCDITPIIYNNEDYVPYLDVNPTLTDIRPSNFPTQLNMSGYHTWLNRANSSSHYVSGVYSGDFVNMFSVTGVDFNQLPTSLILAVPEYPYLDGEYRRMGDTFVSSSRFSYDTPPLVDNISPYNDAIYDGVVSHMVQTGSLPSFSSNNVYFTFSAFNNGDMKPGVIFTNQKYMVEDFTMLSTNRINPNTNVDFEQTIDGIVMREDMVSNKLSFKISILNQTTGYFYISDKYEEYKQTPFFEGTFYIDSVDMNYVFTFVNGEVKIFKVDASINKNDNKIDFVGIDEVTMTIIDSNPFNELEDIATFSQTIVGASLLQTEYNEQYMSGEGPGIPSQINDAIIAAIESSAIPSDVEITNITTRGELSVPVETFGGAITGFNYYSDETQELNRQEIKCLVSKSINRNLNIV